MSRFMGMEIVATPLATERVEDWSRVRSPGRARRRRRYRQNIRIVEKPSAYVMGGRIYAHPAIVTRMKLEARDLASVMCQ